MQKIQQKIHDSSYNRGFSLLELVVVLALMGILLGVVTPQFYHKVIQNRARACSLSRENIASILERETLNGELVIVDGSGNIDTTAISSFFSSNEEIKENTCPQHGHFTVTLIDETSGKIGIECDESHHEPVYFFADKLLARTDEFLADTPVPTPIATPTEAPTAVPTETPSETPSPTPTEKPVWPYQDDERWGEDPTRNTIVKLTPSPIFTDYAGTGGKYVIIKPVEVTYEWSVQGPEALGVNMDWGSVVPLGSRLEVSQLICYPYSNQYSNVGFGDYVVIDGVYYVMCNKGNSYNHVDELIPANMTPGKITGTWYCVPTTAPTS